MQLQRMHAARSRARFVPENWTELGPRPQVDSFWGDVAGRVTALAVDLKNDKSGNTVYVGTAFGGVWKSTDALSVSPTFTPLGDSSLGMSVGSIALDSSTNPPTVYLGTGEANNSSDSYYGVGILSLPKGKLPWTNPVATANDGKYSFLGASVSRILVSPENPLHLYAAITDASGSVGRKPAFGIYESSDGGKKWNLSLEGPPTDIFYEEGSRTYYAAIRGAGIYKNEQGQGWKLTKSPFQCRIGISDANFSRASLAGREGTVWVLISDSTGFPAQPFPADTGLFQSSNGGESWIPVQLPDGIFGSGIPQGDYDQFIAAPRDSRGLVMGGLDVWYTPKVEGMYTAWANLTNSYTNGPVHPDQHCIVAVDSRKWYVGNDGGLWTTTNSGGSWANLNSSLGAIQFTSTTPDLGSVAGYFGGSQDNGTAYSVAGGLEWRTTWSGDGGFTMQNDRDTLQIFTENYHVSLQRSDFPDGDWVTVVDSRTINERDAFYVPYALAHDDPDRIILGTYRVWRGPAVPECPGAGWTPISADLTDGAIQDLAVAPSSRDIMYVVTSDSLVFKTEDGTKDVPSWDNVTTSDLPTGRAFTSVAVNPLNPKIVYIAIGGFNTGHIFKSDNSGGTWTDISGNLINVPVNTIFIDPSAPNELYIGTDLGVFFSDDGGTKQTDWEQYSDGLPLSAVMQLKMNTVGGRSLVAATHGRGAWTIPLRHRVPDFSLIMNPRVQTGMQGKPIKTIAVKAVSTDNYSRQIALSCNAGTLKCSVVPKEINTGDSATISIDGVFQDSPVEVKILGTAGTDSHSQTAVAVVSNQ